MPLEERPKKAGERLGPGWKLYRVNRVQRLLTDVERWKTAASKRFITPKGNKGAFSIFGKPKVHFDLAQHLTAERRQPWQGRSGRIIDHWKQIPGRENHWFDCLVGCLAIASTLDIKHEGEAPKRKKKRYSASQRQREKRMLRGY
jgi:hypothetical protein